MVSSLPISERKLVNLWAKKMKQNFYCLLNNISFKIKGSDINKQLI